MDFTGGDVKLFKDDDSDVIIKLYGPRSKKLITLTDNSDHPLKLTWNVGQRWV